MRDEQRQAGGEKVCFFSIVPVESSEDYVRFGVTRRPEAQVLTSLHTWSRIRALLAFDGYTFVGNGDCVHNRQADQEIATTLKRGVELKQNVGGLVAEGSE